MLENSLLEGRIIKISLEHSNIQDYIEVMLSDGNIVVVTASINGKLMIWTKID